MCLLDAEQFRRDPHRQSPTALKGGWRYGTQ
jgi:hypothetical protein